MILRLGHALILSDTLNRLATSQPAKHCKGVVPLSNVRLLACPPDEQELGLGFDGKCRTGTWIAQVVRDAPEPEQLELPLVVAPTAEQPDESEAPETDSEEPSE